MPRRVPGNMNMVFQIRLSKSVLLIVADRISQQSGNDLNLFSSIPPRHALAVLQYFQYASKGTMSASAHLQSPASISYGCTPSSSLPLCLASARCWRTNSRIESHSGCSALPQESRHDRFDERNEKCGRDDGDTTNPHAK